MRIFIVLAMFTLAACGGGSGTPGGGMNDGSGGAGGNGGMTGGETDDGTGSGSDSSGSDGGGTDGGSNQVSLLEKWQRFENGNPTLDMTSAEISEALNSQLDGSTHFLIEGEEGSYLVWPLDYLAYIDFDMEVLRASAVMSHNGVPVAESRVRITSREEDSGEVSEEIYRHEEIGYAGWLDYTSFWIGHAGCEAESSLYEQVCSGTDFFDSSSSYFIAGSAFGDHSGTTPTGVGSATWTGVMVGVAPRKAIPYAPGEDPNPGATDPDVFFGNAQIKIDDLAAPDADVSFTGIHNVTNGKPRSDISWESLLIADGVFGTGSEGSDDYIAGMFNGPGNPEVGGYFARDGISGAFGAKRQ